MPDTPSMVERFATADELEALVRDFEAAAIPRARWTHGAHVAVATRYALLYDDAEATRRVRDGILRLNAANGVEQTMTGGYHETLTRFYMWAVRRHLRGVRADLTPVEMVNSTIAALWDRSIALGYWSRDRLMSWDARTTWLEPDLKPLD
jgi:hypothetical protein